METNSDINTNCDDEDKVDSTMVQEEDVDDSEDAVDEDKDDSISDTLVSDTNSNDNGKVVAATTKPGNILRVQSDMDISDNNNESGTTDKHHHRQDAGGAGELPTTTLPKQSWLLRLFQSTLFDSSMSMTYLFNSKEPGVLEYIGNKLFNFSNDEVDFYLPQLINMYIMMHAVAEVIHPYLIARWESLVYFSTRAAGKRYISVYNHGEGPFFWLKAPTSAFTFKTLS